MRTNGYLGILVCWMWGGMAMWAGETATNPLAAGGVAEAALPTLLRDTQGQSISTQKRWRERREELLALFQTEVYGKVPATRWTRDFWITRVNKEAMSGAATLKMVEIVLHTERGELTIPLTLFVPNKRTGPAPAFLLICNRGPQNIDPDRKVKSAFWPAEQIVAAGYAAVAFHNASIAPDRNNGFAEGVFPLLDENRNAESWGAIAAWAWGASRVMDYLWSDPDVDREKVAVIGHSRGGKAALVAGAFDTRFALTVSNDSGCTGAALSRRRVGETVAKINEVFPHWFCLNYRKYNDREQDLPVDQHQLIACIAPRAVYVASATGDGWADPVGEYQSLRAAAPVWALYDRQCEFAPTFPKPDQPVWSGPLGYHIRTGEHNLTEYDWAQYLKFAARSSGVN